MTVTRGFLITIASGLGFGVLGGAGGYTLATFAPDYYRTVFGIQPEEKLNLVQAGVGLGVTQGFAAGVVIGLVIVVTVAWFNSRKGPAAP